MSVRLVCRGCLAPSIHPSENQCVAKHGGMVEMYQRLKYYYRTEGQKPSAEIIEGHCKFFVEVMSVCLVCHGCLALSIHPSENQCVAKHVGMVEIYQRLKYYYIAKGHQPSAKITEGHYKFFVAIMSLCLVCRGGLAPTIHPSENQCMAKYGGMVEMY